MSQVLYRIHRPLKFSEIVGQGHIVTTLSNQIKNNKLSHAYLFTGSRGIGKTSVARILARAVNCEGRKADESEPDNECSICKSTLNGNNLDFLEIDAASHTGVDDIRELIEHLSTPPLKSKYRTFIIDEVHMLSKSAFNALLKTLEEPPAHALFILATTELHKLPETIISRTQRFDFKRFNSEEIEKELQRIAKIEKLKIDESTLKAIAGSVDGGMRDAVVMLEKASHLEDQYKNPDEVQKYLGITPIRFRKELLDLIKNSDLSGIASFFSNLSTDGYNLEQFNADFLNYIRELLSKDMTAEIARIADAFIKAHGQMRFSPIPELPLLVASVNLINLNNGEKDLENSSDLKYIKPSGDKMDLSNNNLRNSEKSNIDLSLEDVENKWMDVLGRVRNYNQSLLSALKLARPLEISNLCLIIQFPYKFHAETVNAPKNRLVIERVLEEVFNIKIAVQCVNHKNLSDKKAEVVLEQVSEVKEVGETDAQSDLINSAISILGGKVVT